jgi:hypothetical protein
MSRKGQEASGNGSRADREQSTADCFSEYKLAACAWPSQAAILETTSVVYKLEIALLATSVESSAISLLGDRFVVPISVGAPNGLCLKSHIQLESDSVCYCDFVDGP